MCISKYVHMRIDTNIHMCICVYIRRDDASSSAVTMLLRHTQIVAVGQMCMYMYIYVYMCT